jgi:PBP1b-binding outer membrane lipoprotein LpoB
MKKILSYILIGAMLFGGAFWGCSDKKEPAAEKGAIRKMTEETAKEAVNRIRTPIDKARSVAKQQEEKNKEMDDALKKQ